MKEMQAYLQGLPLELIPLSTLGSLEPFPEDGHTFSENARGKSVFYSRLWDGLTLGEDSGLEVDQLGGAPGVFSARFSGPKATDQTNINKVLGLLGGVPEAQRTARFVSCMVLSRRGRILTEILARAEGRILESPKGARGFGYDPIFYYPPFEKTFAELEREEKNRVSHRGQALSRLREYLSAVVKRG